MASMQIGAIPYIKKNGKIKLAVITSRSSGKWIFPKGQLEDGMSRSDVAALEAYEEAGVTGKVVKSKATVVIVRRKGQAIRLRLYPLKVNQILSKWPEDKQRKRVFVSPRKASILLGDKSLSRLVKHLEKVI